MIRRSIAIDGVLQSAALLTPAGNDTTLDRMRSPHSGEYHGPGPRCRGKDRFVVWPRREHPQFWCRRFNWSLRRGCRCHILVGSATYNQTRCRHF